MKNYKKISVAIGALFNMILLAVLGYSCSVAMSLDPNVAGMIIGILYAIEGFTSIVLISIFGKAENGNGYGVPESKTIIDLVQQDKELQDMIKTKIKSRMKKSRILNDHDKCDNL